MNWGHTISRFSKLGLFSRATKGISFTSCSFYYSNLMFHMHAQRNVFERDHYIYMHNSFNLAWSIFCWNTLQQNRFDQIKIIPNPQVPHPPKKRRKAPIFFISEKSTHIRKIQICKHQIWHKKLLIAFKRVELH